MVTAADDERSVRAFCSCQRRRQAKGLPISKLAQFILSPEWDDPQHSALSYIRGERNGALLGMASPIGAECHGEFEAA